MLIVTFSVSLLTINSLGTGGIALADTLGVFVEAGLLMWWLRARLPEALSRLTQSVTFKVIGASAVMGVAIFLWLQLIGERSLFIVAGGGIAVGAAMFAGVALLLGVEEIRHMPRLMLRRA
jgi:peptidoglycan biosynthesis protein MviN/MurJ (putative lipid II flippase)